jgi:hypothetical protein
MPASRKSISYVQTGAARKPHRCALLADTRSPRRHGQPTASAKTVMRRTPIRHADTPTTLPQDLMRPGRHGGHGASAGNGPAVSARSTVRNRQPATALAARTRGQPAHRRSSTQATSRSSRAGFVSSPRSRPARLPRVCAVTCDYVRGPKLRNWSPRMERPDSDLRASSAAEFGATMTPRATHSVLPVRQALGICAVQSPPGSVGRTISQRPRRQRGTILPSGPTPAQRALRRAAASTSARRAGYKAHRAHRGMTGYRVCA